MENKTFRNLSYRPKILYRYERAPRIRDAIHYRRRESYFRVAYDMWLWSGKRGFRATRYTNWARNNIRHHVHFSPLIGLRQRLKQRR